MSSAKTYLKNFYKYMKNKGFKQGGVAYVNLTPINDKELLYGKKILVTGGSSGIGFAVAKRCIESGARVIITGRSKDRLKEAVNNLGNSADYYVSDIRNITEYDEFLKSNHFDCIVNNAGISPSGADYIECDENVYNEVMDINLKSVYFLCQSYINCCLSNGVNGNIVNIASNSGLVGLTSVYGLSKKAIVSLTEGIAKKYCKCGIRCNAVAPDVTISNITDWSSRFDPNGNLADQSVASGRVFRAEEVAEVVLFLLSDRSSCVNGQTIACDNAGSLAKNSVG